MKRIIGFTLQEFLRVQMLMLFAVAAFGQSPNAYQITPERTTMLSSESRGHFAWLIRTGMRSKK
jgi:hypothetical protein